MNVPVHLKLPQATHAQLADALLPRYAKFAACALLLLLLHRHRAWHKGVEPCSSPQPPTEAAPPMLSWLLHCCCTHTNYVHCCCYCVPAGIEHDIKVWGPTAPGPLPPPAAALQRAMAANQRERRSARDAYSEPEQWLLQLLAAQRRRWVHQGTILMIRLFHGSMRAATLTEPC
jgi:hypothetical protein